MLFRFSEKNWCFDKFLFEINGEKRVLRINNIYKFEQFPKTLLKYI